MTKEELDRIAYMLWGQDWPHDLTYYLNSFGEKRLNIRTAQRWMSGQIPVPDWLTDKLINAVKDRIPELQKVVDEYARITESVQSGN